jgi:hypothetical protein
MGHCDKQLPDDDATSRCYYMAHSSNPFYVLLFLVRVAPFTSLHLEICDKKFPFVGIYFEFLGLLASSGRCLEADTLDFEGELVAS